ncbi:hypothetical protein MYP_825 [Sporocytophaga myxococcoides]|uniref:Uncharacterized protein n=1 Tax=Sporocytophaga myxococcoides TaxID=153721 RepID=A0A098LBD4_9BACT|nr:hypothetical protein MYP_825 [Sporocytophaga myxococcoides]
MILSNSITFFTSGSCPIAMVFLIFFFESNTFNVMLGVIYQSQKFLEFQIK